LGVRKLTCHSLVLYSYIAQTDNPINAKIAVSSARDSSAMKTLALITTVFLPGAYIAVRF
jgi:glutamate-1-semialdehyde 2,1-aminomutase